MGSLFEFIFYLFILLLTGLLALKPRFFWEHIDKWYSENEPSEFRFDMIRMISGVLFFILLLIGFRYYY